MVALTPVCPAHHQCVQCRVARMSSNPDLHLPFRNSDRDQRGGHHPDGAGCGALVIRRFVGSQVNQRLERRRSSKSWSRHASFSRHVLTPDRHLIRLYPRDRISPSPHRRGRLLSGPATCRRIAAHRGWRCLRQRHRRRHAGRGARRAIRTKADENFDPAAILDALNQRLLGRAGGHFATCVAAHLRPAVRCSSPMLDICRRIVTASLSICPAPSRLAFSPARSYDVHTIQLDPRRPSHLPHRRRARARNTAGQLWLRANCRAFLAATGCDRPRCHSSWPGRRITVVSVRVGSPGHVVESASMLASSPV